MKSNKYTLLGILTLITIIAVVGATFTIGCIESPDVQNGVNIDENIDYIRGDAVVESIDLLIMESFPVQVSASAIGYLPDGCTEIDEENITVERNGNVFNVSIQTLRPKEAMCTQEIVPFEQRVELDVYGLEKGNYIVNINGVEGTFNLATDNIIPE